MFNINLNNEGGSNGVNILVTGGSGFFGSILKEYLANKGINVINFDILPDPDKIDRVKAVQGDITNKDEVDACFKKYGPFDCICHVAAQLVHSVNDKRYLWTSNVRGTEVVVKTSIKYKVPKLIFTSSNCLWGQPFSRPILETDSPNPVEIYGKSKWEAEKILSAHKNYIDSIIIRCPTIISAGRLGLLAILYEFINENKNIYVVGKGGNKYQFIYSLDLCESILKAFKINKTDVYNIGSDNVKTFREIYSIIIDKSGSNSKIISLPKKATTIVMMLCYKLGISPWDHINIR